MRRSREADSLAPNATSESPVSVRGQNGFTIIELLIVIGIVGIIAGIGIFNGRRVLQSQQENAAIVSIQQTVWQGATAAAARGHKTIVERSGDLFTLTDATTGKVLKTFELPSSVTSNWPQSTKLTFTPPGKVESLAVLPTPLTLVAGGRTTTLTLSLIGEVKAEVTQ